MSAGGAENDRGGREGGREGATKKKAKGVQRGKGMVGPQRNDC